MADPMTRERITEIRRRADLVREFGERPTVEASAGDVPALLAEVEWLSGEKAEADKRARQAEAERDRLAGQVQRVREAHPRRDDPTGPVCGGCGLDAYEEPIEWPCPTIRALGGTEAGR